ncbi:MAG: hypothetical protein ACLTA5_03720 [Anaerococcus obesiensis]
MQMAKDHNSNIQSKSNFWGSLCLPKEPYDFSAYVQKIKIISDKEFRKLINETMPKSFLINYIDLISKKCLILSQKIK